MRLADLFQGDNRFRTAMAMNGIGSAMRGQDVGPMLQNIMMMDMMEKDKEKEAEQRRQAETFMGNIFGGGQAMPQRPHQPVSVPKPNSPEGVASDAMAALGKSTFTPGDRESFVKAMMPHAQREAARLGIDPRIIVAQAAQETGWGKHAPNNNFFGIKSHGKGGGQTFSTKEYINGQPVTITDSFRQYGGMGDSVRGYADFLLENPRYQEMLNAEGLDAQLAALGRSGYATDPNYASSVGAIAHSIGAPQPVQVAQNGQLTREQVVQALRMDGLSEGEKKFILSEYRAQQQQGGLTGKERYMNVDGVLYDVSGPQPVAVTERQAKDPAAVQKINRIQQAYGVDEKTAVGIADGVLKVSRDPYTDQIQVTNLATNETWNPSVRGEPEQTATSGQVATPEQVQEAQPQTFSDPYQGASDAFGFEGMLRRGVNAASDFVTGEEVFPETGQAIRDFNLLREDITQDLQAAYGQRVPSWALQALRDLTPAAGTFQGQGSAKGQLVALGRRFQQELEATEASLANAGRRSMSPEDLAARQSERSALRRSLAKIQSALGGFEGNQSANTTSSGVKWRVKD